MHVSQAQVLEPFLAIPFAVPLLGEPHNALTLGFPIALITTAFI